MTEVGENPTPHIPGVGDRVGVDVCVGVKVDVGRVVAVTVKPQLFPAGVP